MLQAILAPKAIRAASKCGLLFRVEGCNGVVILQPPCPPVEINMNMPKPLAVNIHQNSKYDSNGPAGSFPPCGLARPPLNQVLNIHEGHLPRMMKNMFIEAVILRRKDQQRLFPTAFLFNDVGLQIWSDITKSETYSQTLEEIRLLEKYGDDIARSIPPGSSLLDIGAR